MIFNDLDKAFEKDFQICKFSTIQLSWWPVQKSYLEKSSAALKSQAGKFSMVFFFHTCLKFTNFLFCRHE